MQRSSILASVGPASRLDYFRPGLFGCLLRIATCDSSGPSLARIAPCVKVATASTSSPTMTPTTLNAMLSSSITKTKKKFTLFKIDQTCITDGKKLKVLPLAKYEPAIQHLASHCSRLSCVRHVAVLQLAAPGDRGLEGGQIHAGNCDMCSAVLVKMVEMYACMDVCMNELYVTVCTVTYAMYVCLSVHLCISVCLCPSIYLYVCMPVCLMPVHVNEYR